MAEEKHEKLGQDNPSPGQDLSPEPAEYKAGMLATGPQRSGIQIF
jgi:hypothetical protein